MHSAPERHSTLASAGQIMARLVVRLLVQASLRRESSRSQNLIRAASMKSLPRPVTPSSSATPALSSRGLAALLAPIAFRCPNASMTNCTAPASFMSVSQPWSDKTIATASNNCDGEPAVGPEDGAVLEFGAADLRRDQKDRGTVLLDRFLHGLYLRSVRSVGIEDADFSSLQCLLHVFLN